MQGQTAMSHDDSTDPTAIGGRAKVVFFVDDNDSLRKATGRMLKARGYEVLLAASAAEAWAINEDHDGEIDVLLMDIMLPDGWGATVAQRLREVRPDMAVVYTTGFAESDPVLAGGLQGTDFVVTKPFTSDELVTELERAMAVGK